MRQQVIYLVLLSFLIGLGFVLLIRPNLNNGLFAVVTNLSRPKVIVHRGLHTVYPENSMESVEAAMKEGFDMIEIDVHQSADSVLILYHDFTIQHKTRGERMLKDLSADEITSIQLAPNIFVPTLESVLQEVSGEVNLIVELKAGTSIYPLIERHLVELIAKFQAKDWVAVHSFSDEVLHNLHDLNSGVSLQKLMVANIPQLHLIVDDGIHLGTIDDYDFVNSLNINYLFANEKFIREAHDRGQTVYVWNLNDVNMAYNLTSMGVDRVITDQPHLINN